MGFPPRVEGDTGAPIFFDFLNDGGPVLFSEIPFPSTRRGPELETGVKEEVVTWGATVSNRREKSQLATHEAEGYGG